MEKMNLSTKVALCFFGLAVALMFIAVCIQYDALGFKLCGTSMVVAGIGAFIELTARMFQKEGFRAKFIAGFLPMALIYGIVTMLYLVFFHECEALGIAGNILMCVAGVYGITAFVLHHIDEAKTRKIKGES